MGYINKLVRMLLAGYARLFAWSHNLKVLRVRYMLPSVIVLALVFITAPSVFVRAADFSPGSYVGIPAAQCTTPADSWHNATLAAGKPSVPAHADGPFFKDAVAATLRTSKDAMLCTEFAVPEQRRQKIGLGLSIAILPNQTTEQQQEADIIQKPNKAAFLLDTPFQFVRPNIPDSPSVDSMLRIDVSADKGATWQTIHTIQESTLSNATYGSYLGVTLPADLAASFATLQVRLQGLREGDTTTRVYVDSVFLAYQVAPTQHVALKPIVRKGNSKPVFAVNQSAAFRLEVDRQGEGIVQGIASQFGSDEQEPDLTFATQVKDVDGQTVEGVQATAAWKGKALNGNDVWEISLEQPATITPGAHTATVTITDETGNVQSAKQDFLWGVLAINTHKSIYQAGETVQFDMAVLDEKGEMVCNAYMELAIEGPHSTELSTDSKTITAHKECQDKQIVDKPDYSGQWEIPKAPIGDNSGTYKLTLTARTAKGEYTITDSFRVGDPEAITVTRTAPTRIMPSNRYTVRMKVAAEQQDFTGTITETVPNTFTLSRYDALYEYVDGNPSKAIPVNATITAGPEPGQQTIAWNASLKKGVAYELRYGYKAPDISPEFYLTGPLTFAAQDNSTMFAEHRQWQIASDAPWLTGWQYRKQITVDQTKVDGNLTDFPVVVKLNSVNFDFSKARSDGFDIRFTSSDMTTTLSYERERHNVGSQLAEYWVKVPSVSGSVDTVFYMYYGNSSAVDGQTGSVWDANHQGVWHLKGSPATTCSGTFETCDSSPQANHADALGAMDANDLVTGVVGTGIQFDGVNDYFQAGDSNNVDGSSRLTISAWVRLDTLRDWSTVLAKVGDPSNYFAMQASASGQGGTDDISLTIANGIDNNSYTSGNILATGVWGYWTLAYDGTATGNNNRLKFYFNGQQQTLTYTDAVPATTSSNSAPILIGQDTFGSWLPGTIDEVRISNNTRSAEWIKASYHSDNGTLLTLGSEEIVNELPQAPEYGVAPMFHNARTNSATPTLGTFWATDPDGDMVQYEIQWDDDQTFGSPVTRSSADHATNGFDAASFDGQYQPASYAIQAGEALTNGTTYWWRVRAMDVGAGTGTWSAYSAARAFTVTTSIGAVNQWHETTDKQFDDDQLAGVRTFGTENASLTPLTYRYVRWEITKRKGPSANSIQAAEFQLRYNNATVAWPSGTTATNPGGNNPANEAPPSAIDGNTATKWLDFNFNLSNNNSLTGNSILVIDVGASNTVTFSGYRWATANDFQERDPVSWNVYGSNDGTNWSLLDARTDQTITSTRNTVLADQIIDPRFDYRYLQFAVTKRRGTGDGMQLSEIQLLNNGSSVTWPSGTTASSAGATYNVGEEPSRLIDGSTSTKLLDYAFNSNSGSTAGSTVVTIDTGANKSIRFDDYRFATANDASARDPVSWKLSGSNDGSTWTTIDIKDDYATTTSRQTYTSALDTLAEPGGLMSEPVLFAGVPQAENWGQFSAATTELSSSNVLVRVYYATSGTTCNARVPDAALTGNSTGLDISSGSVNLSGLNTTTYSVLCIGAKLRPGTTTTSPSLNDWTITWDRNTEPSTPTTVGQTRTDTTTIATGTWINDSSVRFTATASNTEIGEAIQLCVEAQPLGVAFTGTETGCGSGVTYSGSPVSLTATLTSLSNHTEYHWQAWTKDIGNVHNFPSGTIAYGSNAESERDFAVDTTAPTGGSVYDGTTIGVDASLNDGSLSSLSANWSGFDASASGLVRYEYSIGTSIGGTDVRGWTNVNTNTSVTATGLTLQTSQAYYVNVRAIDTAGNTQSPAISSSGQLVAPSLSFTASPATMTFANLNIGNDYTDTKTTTLTTSTNAYGGYIVRLASTDYLRDETSSLPLFAGGTYDFPDAWQPDDIGFGYTSSDASVQGANKFQAATCPGGSALIAPGCYAPYSQARPGDIVVDHATPISGTPVTNQQFTITHRVTAASTQRASTYSVVLLYAATAHY